MAQGPAPGLQTSCPENPVKYLKYLKKKSKK